MRIEILGSGGAITTPRPLCACAICERARADGPPEARSGPSVFVHGPDLLIDTPEEAKDQLNRARIRRIGAVLYSHWHPDHTAGRRVLEALFDFRGWPAEAKESGCIDVYLPQQVAADFEQRRALADNFDYFEHRLRIARRHVVPDGRRIELDGLAVTPLRLAEDYVYAFLLEDGRRRALVAMDELNGWNPPELGPLDLALLPLGLFELHPFTGERALHPEHPVLRVEATYPETLEIVRRLDARRVVLSHVEHLDALSHEELEALGRRDGFEPAYDGMRIELD